MQNFINGLKDFLYDSIDYIIMIGIIGVVVLIIGWRLDLLFASDADDIVPNENIIVQNEHNEDESSDPIHDDEEDEPGKGEEETTEPEVEEEPEKPVDPEKPKAPVVDNSSSTTITVNIPAGSSLSSIAGILESNGLVNSKTDFVNKSEELQLTTKVKAGSFKIQSGSSIEDILMILTK